MDTKKYITVGITTILLLFNVSCSRFSKLSGPPPGEGPPPAPSVSVVNLEEKEVTETEEYIGKIYARDTVDIVARVRGYLKKHYFTEGSIVKEGSLLFLIEPDEYQAEVDQAAADIEKIKASLIKDEKNLNRVQELVQQDFISHSSYDQALSTRDNSIAELKAKEAMLKKAKLNLSYTKIYAPINGKIGSLMVTEGNLVGPDTGSMATIVKLNPIYVTYNIPADDFTKLRLKLAKEHKSIENHQIELILSDGAPYAYKGTQDFFDNKIDETTGTIKLRARFPNPDGILLPGQLCNIIVYSNKPVIKQVLPQSAILEDTAGKFVYIVTKEKTVQRQGIETGRQIGKDWVIKDGIEPDDQVISTGLQKIKHGMSVNILSDQTNNADSKGSH